MKVDIGIIGAMEDEVSSLVSMLSDLKKETVGALDFYIGTLHNKRVAIVKCGIGKVFAAMAAQTLAISYSPSLMINTGVAGAIKSGIGTGDIVIADKLVQHDMDTSPLGDPVGLVSGINKIYFDADARAVELAKSIASELNATAYVGTVASGDRFVASKSEKERIAELFSASACEMEGASIAQVSYVNSIPFVVIRAISDSADGEASMDYPTFVKSSAKLSAKITSNLVMRYDPAIGR